MKKFTDALREMIGYAVIGLAFCIVYVVGRWAEANVTCGVRPDASTMCQ